MNQQVGTGSIQLATPVYIRNSASIVGTKEGEGPLGELFDMVGSDDWFGCKTWRVFDTYTPFTNPVGIEMPIFFCQILISLFHVTLRCGII